MQKISSIYIFVRRKILFHLYQHIITKFSFKCKSMSFTISSHALNSTKIENFILKSCQFDL